MTEGGTPSAAAPPRAAFNSRFGEAERSESEGQYISEDTTSRTLVARTGSLRPKLVSA
jgi:hypothetical protein